MMTQVNPLWRNIHIYIRQCRRRHILNDLLFKGPTEHPQLVFPPPHFSGTHLFAYAQMLSTRGQLFSTASTFPRETYSPACSFTRSFLRSGSTENHAACTSALLKAHTKDPSLLHSSPIIFRQPSGWISPMSPVQNHRCPFSSSKKSSCFLASLL